MCCLKFPFKILIDKMVNLKDFLKKIDLYSLLLCSSHSRVVVWWRPYGSHKKTRLVSEHISFPVHSNQFLLFESCKGGLIPEGIFNLVSSWKKPVRNHCPSTFHFSLGWKVEKRWFCTFFEYGSKLKMHPKIKPPLYYRLQKRNRRKSIISLTLIDLYINSFRKVMLLFRHGQWTCDEVFFTISQIIGQFVQMGVTF